MRGKVLKRLQREILVGHIGPFLFCFLIVMFLLLMQFLIYHIDKLVGKGIPIAIILELILTNLAYMVVLAVPMAVLVSSLMAFGKFAENNELAAVKAAGISPMSLIRPVMVAALILFGFLAWFSDQVLPDANYKARSLFIDIRMQKPGFDLRENVFYDGIDSYNFLVRRIEASGDSLRDITLFQEGNAERSSAVVKADHGYMQSVPDTDILSLYLFDGQIVRNIAQAPTAENRIEKTRFETYRINFDLSDLNFNRSDPDRRRRDDRTMTSAMMKVIVDSLQRDIQADFERLTAYKGINRLYITKERFEGDSTENFRKLLSGAEMAFQPPPSWAQTIDLPENVVETELFSLNQLEHRERQRQVASRAQTNFRTTIAQLNNLQNNIQWRSERSAVYMVEIYKKVSIPFACLIFVMVAAPLGMLTRKGNIGFNALISAGLFTYYWISVIQGEKLADRMIISPITGMWFGNVTLFILGIYLLLKVVYEFRISDLWNREAVRKS